MDPNKYRKRQKFQKLPEDFNHQESQNFISNWEYTKTLSTYHFDPFKIEYEGDWIDIIGKFEGDWDTDLKKLIEISENLTWKELSSSGKHPGFKNGVSITIDQEFEDRRVRGLIDNDFTQLVLHDDVMSLPTFKKMLEYWHLEKFAVRGQVQKPGQCYIMHIDKLWHRSPLDPSRIIRIVINLTDYVQGQLVQYGNYNFMQWKKGQIHTFDHFNVPHCTANLSDSNRPILVITGLKTEKTCQILKDLNKDSIISI
jgi:hypothetical protein